MKSINSGRGCFSQEKNEMHLSVSRQIIWGIVQKAIEQFSISESMEGVDTMIKVVVADEFFSGWGAAICCPHGCPSKRKREDLRIFNIGSIIMTRP